MRYRLSLGAARTRLMSYVTNLAEAIRSRVPSDLIPEGDTTELFKLYALLALVKRENVTASDVHDAWSVWMSTEKPDHPSIRPFEDLPTFQQEEDQPFLEAIRATLGQGL
jgi:hypothetical protein